MSDPNTLAVFRSSRGLFLVTSILHIPRPRDEVFAFFADARNLPAITPPWLKFKVLTPPPILMRTGQLIDYGLRLRGIPVRWQSEISSWDPPFCFVDEQRRGPYSVWIHQHVFEEHAGGTTVKDTVRYAVPGGRLINRFFVQPDVEKIFRFRAEKLCEIFGKRDPA